MIGWIEDNWYRVLAALAIFAFMILPLILYPL
jgi:hypothetical protein